MRRSRLQIVKPQIRAFFDNQKKSVYTFADLGQVFDSCRSDWSLPRGLSFSKFLDFLEDELDFAYSELHFRSGDIGLFFWGDPNILEIAMSLRPKGYLSHYSALYCHHLTSDAMMHSVYINDEQSKKPSKPGTLEQSRIDAALSRPARESTNTVVFQGITILIHNGKNTERLGVIEAEVPEISTPIRVTSLERTLIDIAVRPVYAGGALTIIEAYRRAAGNVSVVGMLQLLQVLDYKYPYHQVIGFYLDYSGGYTEEEVRIFYELPKKYDFYLDYQMNKPKYSVKWKIYYPDNL